MSDFRIAALIFVTVLASYALSRNVTPFDSRWVIHSVASLLHRGDLDLDEYKPQLRKHDFYHIECVGPGREYRLLVNVPQEVKENCAGRYYNYYPLAVPLLAVPWFAAAEAAVAVSHPVWTALGPYAGAREPLVRSLARGDLASVSVFMELILASFFTALAAAIVYYTCREDLPPAWSAALALAFAFLTPAWSTASRALWQHTLAIPLLAAALYLLNAARRKPSLAGWAGLPLMAAYWLRPTNLVSLAVFLAYTAVFYRRSLPRFLVLMAPPAILFGLVTYSIYGSPLAPYASASRAAAHLGAHGEFWLAAAGNLFSPARGLFVFVPFLALAPFGWTGNWACGAQRALHWAVLAVFAGNTMVVASFVDWWGGHCFGPRFYADLSPMMIFLAVPLVQRIREGSRILGAAALMAACFGFFVHWQGANSQPVLDWNVKPIEIRQAVWRIWDWSDPPFLRGLR